MSDMNNGIFYAFLIACATFVFLAVLVLVSIFVPYGTFIALGLLLFISFFIVVFAMLSTPRY
ncbi:hypothetical protein RAE01_21100 [Bacillus velezensis]|uniref:hypothetical protein n=1 Tax=Bacillus velezensis TaxID=492670 RepID=UPI003977D407